MRIQWLMNGYHLLRFWDIGAHGTNMCVFTSRNIPFQTNTKHYSLTAFL